MSLLPRAGCGGCRTSGGVKSVIDIADCRAAAVRARLFRGLSRGSASRVLTERMPSPMIFPHAQSYDIAGRRIEENPDALSAAEDGAEQRDRGRSGSNGLGESDCDRAT